MDPLVYRIVTVEQWEEMKVSNALPWSSIDKRDGFIHLSLESEIRETANRYFGELKQLVILAFHTSVLGNHLRMEVVEERQGLVFPHFYGEVLSVDQVHDIFRLRNSSDGFGELECMNPSDRWRKAPL